MNLTPAQYDFCVGIYREHLQEASFLYEQRLNLLDDPELTWKDIQDFEDRFEPHIDGLIVGGDLALEVCQVQAAEGDAGELHAAVRVFCRQKRMDLLSVVFANLESTDTERITAVCEALIHEDLVGWEEKILGLIADQPPLAYLAMQLKGYKRLSAGPDMLTAMKNAEAEIQCAAIWSLGRLRTPQAREPLFQLCLHHQEDGVRAAAALALLRLGEPEILTVCSSRAERESWPFLALGLGGSLQAAALLRRIAATERITVEGILALGLLGDIASIDVLYQMMLDKHFAEAAASALFLVTGADLFEEIFIPEKIEEDELFEEEKEKLRRGESLTPPGSPPSGTTLRRISQKAKDWHEWWAANSSRFSTGVRYRNGVPYSSAGLVENLQSENLPRKLRQLVYEELVIRYGADFPFDTGMFVAQQKQAIARYALWQSENNNRFEPGKWFFAARRQ